MVRRSTVVWVLVLIALLVFAFFWQRYKKSAEANATPTATSENVLVFKFKEADVESINISDTQGHSVDLTQKGNNTWLLAGQTISTTDSIQVGTAVSSLVSLTSMAKMDPSMDVEQIGLLKPTKTLIVQTADGNKYTLLVGNATVIGTGTYAKLNGDAPVVVDKYALDTVLNLLDNPPIMPTATPTVPPSETPTQAATLEATPTPKP